MSSPVASSSFALPPMQVTGRRAARELALLILFQLEDRQGNLPAALPENFTMAHAIRSAIQSLTLNAQEQLEHGLDFFKQLYDQLADFELEHPTNLNSPLEAVNRPVPLPRSRETMQQAKDALHAIGLVWEAMHVPQLIAQANLPEVATYCDTLVNGVLTHRAHLDEVIGHYSQDWKTSRLVKMDRVILRIALSELVYQPTLDRPVVINEAVDLAKQYSQDDSHKFINGLLGRVSEQLVSKQPLLPATSTPTDINPSGASTS